MKKFFDERTLTLLAFAFLVFMMLYNLTYSSPWGDEWVEYSVSQASIKSGAMYKRIISTYQPPLYNFLMHFWLVPSKTVLWFRLFNIPCGLIAGIFIFSAVKRLTNFTTAFLTVFAMGATYRWIYCIQECSEYALMLMFLAAALYFYVKETTEHATSTEALLILSCVGSMYSQYGAFFIVTPLLITHFIIQILKKDRQQLLATIRYYIGAFLFFALPLYLFFTRIQIAKQKIVANSAVALTPELIKTFPLVLGKLIAYFLNLRNFQQIDNILTVVGVIILILGVWLLTKRDCSLLTRSLAVIFLCGYTIHYLLVSFHIYAMVHPGESSGFYSRYSYFFMPVFYVVMPLIFLRALEQLRNASIQKHVCRALIGGLIVVLGFGYPSLLANWHKTYDKEFATIWIYNAGFNETTFLIGGFGGSCRSGFNYYTSKYAAKGTGKVFETKDIKLDKLPVSFWLWSANESRKSKTWKTTVDAARKQGYKIVIYADYGYGGKLAFCCK